MRKVTQADVEAVKNFHNQVARCLHAALTDPAKGDLLGEDVDYSHPIYQAFATHRLAAYAAGKADERERSERVLEALIDATEIIDEHLGGDFPDSMKEFRAAIAAATEGAKIMMDNFCQCPLHTLFPQRMSELLEPTLLDLKAACALIGNDTYGKPHWTPETISPHSPVVQAFARHAKAAIAAAEGGE